MRAATWSRSPLRAPPRRSDRRAARARPVRARRVESRRPRAPRRSRHFVAGAGFGATAAPLRSQLEPQQLAAGSARQRFDELDPPRILVRRERLLDVLLELRLELGVAFPPDVRHDE